MAQSDNHQMEKMGTSDQIMSNEELAFQAWIAEQERNIKFWISEFDFNDGRWKSFFEMDAWYAQRDINTARQKIRELQEEIEKQEAIIRASEKEIKKHKQHEVNKDGANKAGRPKKSQERQDIAKSFTAQWVTSLMNAFKVKTCAELEEVIVGSNQRNWRRWLNGQAVPTYNHLSTLLCAKIERGNYLGKQLQDVSINPNHHDLLSLVRLI